MNSGDKAYIKYSRYAYFVKRKTRQVFFTARKARTAKIYNTDIYYLLKG